MRAVVLTLSRLESIGGDSDKMSSFHYDGPRNVLCTPASMSRDVRIEPTPEPTPTAKPKRASDFSRAKATHRISAITAATALGENEEGLVDTLPEQFTLGTVSYSPAE